MSKSVFGNVVFNYGFDTKANISLLGKEYDITVTAAAYREQDGISEKQEKAYQAYKASEQEKLTRIEELLQQYRKAKTGNPSSRAQLSTLFTPRTLLFGRDGAYALLLDDAENPDEGLAVCLAPKEKVVSQDGYL
jgi:hypothetical protein